MNVKKTRLASRLGCVLLLEMQGNTRSTCVEIIEDKTSLDKGRMIFLGENVKVCNSVCVIQNNFRNNIITCYGIMVKHLLSNNYGMFPMC